MNNINTNRTKELKDVYLSLIFFSTYDLIVNKEEKQSLAISWLESLGAEENNYILSLGIGILDKLQNENL